MDERINFILNCYKSLDKLLNNIEENTYQTFEARKENKKYAVIDEMWLKKGNTMPKWEEVNSSYESHLQTSVGSMECLDIIYIYIFLFNLF